MFGHVARHHRRWPWVTLSFLFALALAWSFGVTAARVDDVWSILRPASAVGLGLSLLRLVVMSISSRRVRRRQDAERGADNSESAVTETNGHPSAEDQPTDGRGRTYEEVFGPNLDLDDDLELGGGSLPLPPDDPERQDDGVSMTAEEPPSEEEPPTGERGPTSDGDSQERLRQMREQFKARAEEAALRVKQREAELQKAVATSDTER